MLGGALRAIWLGAIVFWMALMMYLWPSYYALEKPSVIGALRNAALMLALNPVFTAFNIAGLGLVALLSIVVPPFALLLAFSFSAIVSTVAARDRLAAAGQDPR